ncbi:MAG: translation initiation factor IF-2 [Salinivirgaceae bacterium]|nr:translation initiation factor IF-2 [Salinivirgaceae bacterium]
MADGNKAKRLSKIAREFNVGISTIVEFLHKKGIEIDANPNTKIESNAYTLLLKEYSTDIRLKEESAKLELGVNRGKQESISIDADFSVSEDDADEPDGQDEVLVKDLSSPKPKANKVKEENFIETRTEEEVKVKVVGKIDLEPKKSEPKATEVKVEEKKPEKEKPVEPKPVEEKIEEKSEPKAEEKVQEKTVADETPSENKVVAEKEDQAEIKTQFEQLEDVKVVGRIDLGLLNQKTRPARKSKEEKAKERNDRVKPKTAESGSTGEEKKDAGGNFIKRKVNKLTGPTVVGKIELPSKKDKAAASSNDDINKKKRKRIRKDRVDVGPGSTAATQHSKPGIAGQKRGVVKKRPIKKEVSEEDVQKQIKDTLARLTNTKTKNRGAKHRRDKREAVSQRAQVEMAKIEAEKNIIKVTEFVSVNELANMMDVQVNQVIATCMNLGLFVSINQRLDAETMALVADEFNYHVEFVSAEFLEAIADEVDDKDDENVISRPPIVTVMGHVDHGKTSLLDYIRSANVIDGEAGGITQHIGAYSVKLEDDRKITFLDTPGHEAFTAMRARGAQVTDVAIIIVAADDSIMPQTVEAINHAQAAGVPIVFAINKIDKPGANPEKIKEGLAQMNMLVEEWGGKYQSQDISAKQGLHIEALLDKVILEAEMLELKANPNKKAKGTVIEATLDKGRGYVTTVLVQSGTLKIGDILLAGNHTGHVKAMYNERNEMVTEAGSSTPVLILGLKGAAQAGDKFNVMDSDREAKEIANRRQQLAREQGLRTQKHITLDEIGRRIAVGNFQELNVIVKGDVDGSIEALSDSLIKLSTEEIQVNIKHKAVGQISESDILLAAASDAIIIGFQVRPSMAARKIAEKEEIDIRLYSVIYDAINEVKDAMEGMLSPDIKEEITATVEVRDVFKITKVGTVAGCYVRDGKIKRSSTVRIIRDGIVVYSGDLGSLKRFKDDVKEVATGYECGLNIEKFNDIKVDDVIEAYEQVEVKRTL